MSRLSRCHDFTQRGASRQLPIPGPIRASIEAVESFAKPASEQQRRMAARVAVVMAGEPVNEQAQRPNGLTYGDRIVYDGRWHAVANIDTFGVWLISLEHKDAVPFLARGVSR